jgi:hypothetical protein
MYRENLLTVDISTKAQSKESPLFTRRKQLFLGTSKQTRINAPTNEFCNIWLVES